MPTYLEKILSKHVRYYIFVPDILDFDPEFAKPGSMVINWLILLHAQETGLEVCSSYVSMYEVGDKVVPALTRGFMADSLPL